LEAVFTANHLTDTDKQNTGQENTQKILKKQTTQNTTKENYLSLVQSRITTLDQETNISLFTMLPSPQWAPSREYLQFKAVA